jgi:leucyl-tRNA synthetase
MDYPFSEIEARWQAYWDHEKTFRTTDDTHKPKYYILDMFPYPSAAGLHVGHPEGYTATDIVSRYKRMRGYNVLHPMGWDAFGLPAEQNALKTGEHPSKTTKRNISTFKRQIKMLGLSYDWDREISTTHPDYFRWTQWIFLKLHERGLAYLADSPVNWCPELGTVLADEEVPEQLDKGFTVEKRMMRQWMLRITRYADRLLEDLKDLDWPENIKQMQRNWIGRSEGAIIRFAAEMGEDLEVFTTRPDTLFGATFIVLAPEHHLVKALAKAEYNASITAYLASAKEKSDIERSDLARKKTGVFTGSFARNPATGDMIPIWVADYVLVSYGTGAIMCVPSDDDRDNEFAKSFDLPIVEVSTGGVGLKEGTVQKSGSKLLPFTSTDGELALGGENIEEAKVKVIDWLERRAYGEKSIKYRMHDWLFSRQRFWGEPFPVIYDAQNRPLVLTESQLPVELPDVETYQTSGTGESPLATIRDWVNTVDTLTGEPARRETNTMPQWAGSSWYYLRFIDPRNPNSILSKEKESYWMPVDLYIGGAEHAVLHLLYARFWHKVLYDIGVVSTKEPFQKLFNQGMILGYAYRCFRHDGVPIPLGKVVWKLEGKSLVAINKETRARLQAEVVPPSEVRWVGSTPTHPITGEELDVRKEKMAKSLGNVVNPDDIVKSHGADALRLYEMFMGPLDQEKTWNTQDIEGVARFLSKSWRFVQSHLNENDPIKDKPDAELAKILNRAIIKITADIEDLRFNTAISQLMQLLTELRKANQLPKKIVEQFVLLLSPFAPHIAEELWACLGHHQTIAYETWPQFDEALAQEEMVTVVFQVNGRVRGQAIVSPLTSRPDLITLALSDAGVQKHLHGATIRSTHVVPQRVVNFETGS